MNFKDKKIVIIHSGSGSDLTNADTINAAYEIQNTLEKLSIKTQIEDVKNPNLLQIISQYDKNVIVFNMVETYGGSDSQIYQFTALLDFFNISYTGATTEFLLLTSNKITTKQILRANKINTPAWIEAKNTSNKKLPKKYIVKSTTEHCSFGIDDSSVSDVNLAKIIDDKLKKHGGNWFAEEYVSGREFDISMMKVDGKVQIFEALEILFKDNAARKHKIFDYDLKWKFSDQIDITFDSGLSEKLTKELISTSLKVWQALGINSYVRIDVRIDEFDKIWVIDINANPCINDDDSFMLPITKFGIEPADALLNILKNTQV